MLSTEVVFSPGSAYAKEVCKWEANHTQYGPPGRPYVYEPYPTAMYKATRDHATGKVDYELRTAGNEAEREKHEHVGFVYGGKAAAFSALEAQEFEIAELAANRAYSDRKMSPEAQAEAASLDAATSRHLAALPETPKRKYQKRVAK